MTNEEKLAEEYRKELKERLLRNDDYERLEMFDENVEEAYLAGRKSISEVIAELAKENAELKKRNGELAGQKASLERWFGEAKEIIKELLESCFGYNSKSVNYEIKAKAEQFLKETEND